MSIITDQVTSMIDQNNSSIDSNQVANNATQLLWFFCLLCFFSSVFLLYILLTILNGAEKVVQIHVIVRYILTLV